MRLIIASQNPNKIREIKAKLPGHDVVGLDPAIFIEELEETGDTLDANARQKAQQVYDRTGENCFADDTGLEVHALNGEPGVLSARYAGDSKDNEANMRLLLERLEGKSDRSAQFRTVISLILNGQIYRFEGVCKGTIIDEKRGDEGFGYDPIFIPEGYDRTFAEMSLDQKSAISHRGKAVEALVHFLKQQ